jgi:hypothetical protein
MRPRFLRTICSRRNACTVGLESEGGDTFGFVYFPEAPARSTRSRPRWELVLTRAQIDLVANGSLESLPFWACSDSDCGRRFWTANALCFDCDYPDREKRPLPQGQFASRREWALAYFAMNPTRSAFAMIGDYNGHTDLGESLGYFTLDEAERAHAEFKTQPDGG